MSAKHQSLQEWHAAGGGVPVRFKGKEHIWQQQVQHLAGGGDPRKRAMYPKMPTQAIIDSPGFDPDVPSDLSRAYARRMADKAEYERNIKDQKLTPTQRGVAGLEAAGMLGSAMFEGVQQLPKLLDSQEAYEQAVGKGMYQPRFQPEKAVEYAGNVGDFLEQLETKYKMPQVLPELLGMAPLADAAKRQAGKAVKQGALTAASRMDAGPTAGSMAAQRGVIKMPGGNFLTGRAEKNVAPLKTQTIAGETPAQRIPKHEELLKDPSLNQDQLDRVKYQLEETKKEAAIDKWVDSNLSNYIKKQLGTPDDPVRALAEQGITHKPSLLDEYPRNEEALMKQRKDAGFPEEGMAQSPLAKAWERASDESIASHRAGDIQGMPEKFAKQDEAERKMIAAREELDKKFLNHIKKSGFNDKEATSVVNGMTYSEKARLVQDQDFLQANIDYLATHDPMMSSYITIGQENPWISKVAPETQLYSPFTGDLGFDHIIDVLKQDVAEGRIRPDQLNKVSMEQAVRRTYEYDQEMAKKMRETAIKQTEGMPVHKEYPEGYKWIELAQPKITAEALPAGYEFQTYKNNMGGTYYSLRDMNNGGFEVGAGMSPELAIKNAGKRIEDPRLEEALKYEGDTMGHCVGGYCPDVIEGRSRIYSLRDAKGEPHVTIETKPGGGHEYAGEKNKEIIRLAEERGIQKYMAPGNEALWAEAEKNLAERGITAPQYIQQIKGKGNRAPKEEYLPFVQDFVKGGKWSSVGDLQNTGLKPYKGSGDLKYVTPEEYEIELKKELGLLPPEEGMKAGGRVNRKHFHEPHLSVGGDLAKIAAKSAKAAKPAAKVAEEAVKEMSMAEKIAKARQAANMAPTARIGLEAPGIIVPGKLNNVREAVRNMKGNYGARRVERAADEIPNLERMFQEDALKEAFTGDNARGLMTIDPADFEKYAHELSKRTSVGPEMAELAKQGDIDKYTVPTDEYIKYLQQIGGFSDVPYLNLFKDEVGLPNEAKVIGHEGRHRNRALANQGQPASLVQIQPRGDLREGMPRRTQEDFIEALKQELDAANRLVIPESEPYFRRPSIQLPDVYAEGGEVHMSIGGDLAKVAAKSAKTAKPAAKAAEKAAEYLPGVHYADPIKPPTMKFSEALGNAGAEGKKLNFTEADRSRVFGSNRGGVGFAGLQHYSEPHKEANTVWGFGNKTTAEKKIRQNDPENTIWTTFVGAPNQHKSNSVVLQDAFKEFNESLKSGKATPRKIELMNERLRSLTDKDTGLPVFDADFDITDPDAFGKLNSFARRGAVGDVFLGEGVKGPMRLKTSTEKWQDTANMEALLRRETDPDLIGAGTYDVGNRLFMLDNGIIERPDLNAAFPWQVTGTDLGMKYEPVPMTTAMRDWAKQYEGRKTKSGKPAPAGYMDLARNNPSQFVSDEYLTWLQKQGKKAGGLAQAKKPKKVARHGNTVPN